MGNPIRKLDSLLTGKQLADALDTTMGAIQQAVHKGQLKPCGTASGKGGKRFLFTLEAGTAWRKLVFQSRSNGHKQGAMNWKVALEKRIQDLEVKVAILESKLNGVDATSRVVHLPHHRIISQEQPVFQGPSDGKLPDLKS